MHSAELKPCSPVSTLAFTYISEADQYGLWGCALRNHRGLHGTVMEVALSENSVWLQQCCMLSVPLDPPDQAFSIRQWPTNGKSSPVMGSRSVPAWYNKWDMEEWETRVLIRILASIHQGTRPLDRRKDLSGPVSSSEQRMSGWMPL